jgi:hypothetical protein
MEGVLVFSRCICYFLIEKVRARVPHTLASGRHPGH